MHFKVNFQQVLAFSESFLATCDLLKELVTGFLFYQMCQHSIPHPISPSNCLEMYPVTTHERRHTKMGTQLFLVKCSYHFFWSVRTVVSIGFDVQDHVIVHFLFLKTHTLYSVMYLVLSDAAVSCNTHEVSWTLVLLCVSLVLLCVWLYHGCL